MAASPPRARRALATAARNVRQTSSPLTSEDEDERPVAPPATAAATAATTKRTTGRTRQKPVAARTASKRKGAPSTRNGDSDGSPDENNPPGDGEGEDDDNDNDAVLSDDSFDSGSEVDMDDTADYIGPGGGKQAKKPRQPKVPKANKRQKSQSKAPRAAKATTKTKRAAKRGPASKSAAPLRGPAQRQDLDINSDVPVFNAVKNPETALQTTAEDWVVAYQSEPGPASAEMINFILRSCGCNSNVDESTVMDLDNVVDTIEQVQEEFKAAPIASYPIVSKAPALKKFKKSLAEFISRLFVTASESELLFQPPVTPASSDDVVDPSLIGIFKEWLSSLSSSSFRSFRHTSTFIVLTAIEALAGLATEKHKQVETARKLRDAERKKGRSATGKLQSLDDKWRAEKEEAAHLQDAIHDLVDGVFQHRYRDADALIRTDCATELGRWMRHHPGMFMKNEYLRHLGWFLGDSSPLVRMATIRSLAVLYSRSAFPDPLRYFTDLFRDRLVQIATGDVDTAVRVATIDILLYIDRRGLLEDTQRDNVGLHIFDTESRIRVEAARFLTAVIQEEVSDIVEEVIGPEPASQHAASKDAKLKEQRAKWEGEVRKLRFKILARKLVAYGKRIDQSLPRQLVEAPSVPKDTHITALIAQGHGRIAHAVDALWAFDDSSAPFTGHSTLMEMLLYDHSGQDASASSASRGRDHVAPHGSVEYVGAQPPCEQYKLETDEESILLEAFVAVLQHIRREADEARTGLATASSDSASSPEQSRHEDATRTVVPALSKLFAKYRTESARVGEVLSMIPTLDLALYAATGQQATFSSLWEEISGQFLRHSEMALLQRGAMSIRALLNSTAGHPELSDLANTKLVALQDTLIATLREPLKGQEVAAAALDEDTAFALRANLQRLAELFTAVDCSEAMEDSDGNVVSSGWEIVREIAQRGKLRYEAEEGMVTTCLRIMTVHLLWRLRKIIALHRTNPSGEDRFDLAADLLTRKNDATALMGQLVRTDMCETLERTRTAAAARLLQIEMAFFSAQQPPSGSAARPVQAQDNAGAGDDAASVDVRPEAVSEQLPKSLHVETPIAEQEGCVNAILTQVESFLVSIQDDIVTDDVDRPAADQDVAAGDEDSDAGEARQGGGPAAAAAGTNASPEARGKDRSARETDGGQGHLQREFELNQSLSPLVSAIRLGLIDIGLVAPLIGKFGRVGRMYDVMAKLLIEVVREEGILSGEGHKAGKVILESLKDSFEAFLAEGSAEAESRFVSFSRSLSSALVIRGAHLAVLRAIDADALLQIHKQGAEYAARKWKAAEAADNKAIKARSPVFWKGLSNLLVSATARDAHSIKSLLEQAVKDAEIDIPATSKSWEPYRQYERRLVALMAKRVPGAPKAGPTPRKAAVDRSRQNGTPSDQQDDFDISHVTTAQEVAPVESTPLRVHRLQQSAGQRSSAKRTATQREQAESEDRRRSRSPSALTELSDLDEPADEPMFDLGDSMGGDDRESQLGSIPSEFKNVERGDSVPAQSKRRRHGR
ncbi:unnamed protein product [Parajaminaea phylloscopi]